MQQSHDSRSLDKWEGLGPTTWVYSSTGPWNASEQSVHKQGKFCWEMGEGLTEPAICAGTALEGV